KKGFAHKTFIFLQYLRYIWWFGLGFEVGDYVYSSISTLVVIGEGRRENQSGMLYEITGHDL
ncbi:hypothetical protein ACJX0J_017861, partial [Zea mays]